MSREDLFFPIIVLDRNGEEIYRNIDTENREWTPEKEIPTFLKDATIFSEDHRFRWHFGIDAFGLFRAIIVNISEGEWKQGASTLSQQISRKVFLTDEKTILRKIKESLIALGLEAAYSKDEILEMYLNIVPYGPRIHGVSIAAEVYFHKSLSELSEAEMLVLAMLPQSPSTLSRMRHVRSWLGMCLTVEEDCDLFSPLYHRTRIEQILFLLSEHYAWPREKLLSVHQELQKMVLSPQKNWIHSDFQHFRFFIEDFLEEKGVLGEHSAQGLRITTTLDAAVQREIFSLIRSALPDLQKNFDIHNLSALILDAETGGPLVWIGSVSFWDEAIFGQVDLLRSARQIGSTIKPFVYAAAIAKGYQPPTLLYDSALVLRGGSGGRIMNADGAFLGGIRMTDALAKSRNTTAIKALFLSGGEMALREYLDTTFDFSFSRDFSEHIFGWSLALGTPPIVLSELAHAFSILANGIDREECPLLRLQNIWGEPLALPCSWEESNRLSPEIPFFIGEMLSRESARPAGFWRNNLHLPEGNIAVKTGTSSVRIGGKIFPVDNLVVGYTPKVVILLWAGNTDGKPLRSNAFAISTIAPLWQQIAEVFFQYYPEKRTPFSPPLGLKKIFGEWATENYSPPSYAPLERFLRFVPERGINPLIPLQGESFEK